LFPHGHGAYDGNITIHEYLNFWMGSSFSSFTLYKPYLLIMYDLWQSLQLIHHISYSCLEKNIQIIKTIISKMTDAEILGHIVKYKLPSLIQSSPMWHRSQL
jgi:hypothetical protein